MDLQEFISQTLIQIVNGVTDAQNIESEKGAKISPSLSGSAEYAAEHGFLKSDAGPAQIVQFDVAITAKEGTGTKGGIGVVAGIVSLGSTGQSNTENSSVSRVKFSVPVTLPNG